MTEANDVLFRTGDSLRSGFVGVFSVVELIRSIFAVSFIELVLGKGLSQARLALLPSLRLRDRDRQDSCITCQFMGLKIGDH